ncbi:MAG: DHH family phosphoesterase [Candidatus Cloacimonadales bacterium]
MRFRLEKQVTQGKIINQIIQNRGYDEEYFESSLADLADMYLMKDLEKAADRIIKAIANKEKIIIFGHDDIDGITATYILFDFLEKAGSQAHYYYIPNRLLENHGLQRNFIDKVKNENFDLVVTVDGGISSWQAVDEINSFGTDVIITDHHLVPEKLPNAFALVDSKQKDCNFPYTMLAGVGVSWYLCRMLAEKLKLDLKPEYLFWTALGTVADKAPLDGLNRIIVKEVLNNWYIYENRVTSALSAYLWSGSNLISRLAVIRYLIKLLSNGRDADGKHKALYFMLNPLREKNKTLKELIQEMREWDEKLNSTREIIGKFRPDPQKFGFLFFDKNDEIALECMGLAASLLFRKYKIPVLFLKRKDGVITCEARCTNGFNLMEMFNYFSEMLIQYGGHVKAAGFTMEEKKLKSFSKHFYGYTIARRDSITSEWKHRIDAVFSATEIGKFEQFVQEDYNKLQPFGQGNPEPTFLMQNFNPLRDSKRFSQKEMIFSENNEYDVVFRLQGSSIKVLDFFPINERDNLEMI